MLNLASMVAWTGIGEPGTLRNHLCMFLCVLFQGKGECSVFLGFSKTSVTPKKYRNQCGVARLSK